MNEFFVSCPLEFFTRISRILCSLISHTLVSTKTIILEKNLEAEKSEWSRTQIISVPFLHNQAAPRRHEEAKGLGRVCSILRAWPFKWPLALHGPSSSWTAGNGRGYKKPAEAEIYWVGLEEDWRRMRRGSLGGRDVESERRVRETVDAGRKKIGWG